MADSDLIAENETRYRIPAWGLGYFDVSDRGHLVMRPDPEQPAGIDMKLLVDDLRRRGLQLPVLIRFTDLIKARVEAIVDAFRVAMEEYEYKGNFRGVYPIKVNQQRQLVEDVLRFSRPHHLGLEAGSKPELLVVLSLLDDPEALIVCNGYKDREYIEMALLARRLGRNCIVVIEKFTELDVCLEASKRLGIRPVVGVRAKLSATGSGRWKDSVGDRAKFGLTIPEIVKVTERLREENMLDTLQLLHFHIGSQVSDIRSVKGALKEATRIYTELHRLGAGMRYLDVGGGLGVDYDGSRTTAASSVNYDVQEYAYDIVAAIGAACDEAEIDHPSIVTESGRFMVTHNSVLVFDVLGTSQLVRHDMPQRPDNIDEDTDEHLPELFDILESIEPDNLQEPYHDAVEIKEEVLTRFNLGLCTLEERARVDQMFWAICSRISQVVQQVGEVSEELLPIQRALADTYFCNFSLFQSAPDSWAIDQLFPICPIHRLHERPSARGVLADITCDSDGKVDRFIGRKVKRVLELHPLEDQPYYLGMFLVGAYQEILGDLHNLFGDTHIVHASVAATPRGYRLDHIVEGDSVKEVLEYVEFDRQRLVTRMRRAIELAIENGQCSLEDGKRMIDTYLRELESYTYLTT
jgi:arginine decarboxylase